MTGWTVAVLAVSSTASFLVGALVGALYVAAKAADAVGLTAAPEPVRTADDGGPTHINVRSPLRVAVHGGTALSPLHDVVALLHAVRDAETDADAKDVCDALAAVFQRANDAAMEHGGERGPSWGPDVGEA